MATGTVKFFNQAKGFGFISPDGGGEDIFVHITSLIDINIKDDDKVSFEIEQGKRGLQAVNVRVTK